MVDLENQPTMILSIPTFELIKQFRIEINNSLELQALYQELANYADDSTQNVSMGCSIMMGSWY